MELKEKRADEILQQYVACQRQKGVAVKLREPGRKRISGYSASLVARYSVAVAADRSGTGNGDIGTIAGNDQVGAGSPFSGRNRIAGVEVIFIVIFRIFTADDDGVGGEVKSAAAFQKDGAGAVYSRREIDYFSGVDRILNISGVQKKSVTDSTEIFDIYHVFLHIFYIYFHFLRRKIIRFCTLQTDAQKNNFFFAVQIIEHIYQFANKITVYATFFVIQ